MNSMNIVNSVGTFSVAMNSIRLTSIMFSNFYKIRFTQQNSCCISKSMMQHLQK